MHWANRAFETTISYVTSSVDPNTRRLPVRANLKNAAGALKPEMFANVQVVVGESEVAAAVPRAAVIYEGETARVWVVDDNHGMELRNIRTGTTNNNLVQVLHPAILEPCRFLRELPPPDG